MPIRPAQAPGRWRTTIVGVALVALCAAAVVGRTAHAGESLIDRIEALPESIDPPADEVLAGRHDALLQVPSPRAELAAVGPRPRWWRLSSAAVDAGHEAPLLVIYAPYTARITLYPTDRSAPISRDIYARELDPRYSRRALVFELPRALAAGSRIWLRTESGRGYPLRLRIATPPDYAAEDLSAVRVLSLFQAAGLTVALVAIFFWLLLREPVFLVFFANLLVQTAYLYFYTGEAASVPGLRELFELGPRATWALATVNSALSIVFLQYMGDLPRQVPRLSRAMWWIAGWTSLLAFLPALPVSGPMNWFPVLGNSTLAVSNTLSIAAMVLAWRKGSRAAAFVLVAWAPLLLVSTLRIVQLSFGLEFPTWLEFGLPGAIAFSAVVITLGLADRMLAFRRERDRAQHEAEIDALTGVLNRKGLSARLRIGLERARVENSALSVLFLDLDQFKSINDAYGHAVGDECLKLLVDCTARELRQADSLGRYGGEEFVVLLGGADANQAAVVAERIRAAVEFRCRAVHGQPVRLTVSIGVAELGAEGVSPERLLERADQALYEAKRGGRNRVCLFGSTPAPVAA